METDCIYAGPDGKSRIARVSLPTLGKVVAEDGTASWGGVQGGKGWGIASGPANPFSDWHPVANPLLSICLTGEWEVETGAGEVRRFGPGSITVFLDETGEGHRSRVVSEEACATIGVRLDEASVADFLEQVGAAALA
jgi:hypothetical protein